MISNLHVHWKLILFHALLLMILTACSLPPEAQTMPEPVTPIQFDSTDVQAPSPINTPSDPTSVIPSVSAGSDTTTEDDSTYISVENASISSSMADVITSASKNSLVVLNSNHELRQLSGGNELLYVVGEVKNQGDEEMLRIQIEAMFVDDADNVLSDPRGGGSLSGVGLPPGERVPFNLSLINPPDNWHELRIIVDGIPVSEVKNPTDRFLPTELVEAPPGVKEGNGYRFTTQIKNVAEWTAVGPRAWLTLYDAAGRVVGMDDERITGLPAGASANFDFRVSSILGPVASYQVIVSAKSEEVASRFITPAENTTKLEVLQVVAFDTADAEVAIIGEIRNNTDTPVRPEASYAALLNPDGSKPFWGRDIHSPFPYNLLLEPGEIAPFLLMLERPDWGWSDFYVEFIDLPDINSDIPYAHMLETEIMEYSAGLNSRGRYEVSGEIKNVDDWHAAEGSGWLALYDANGKITGLSDTAFGFWRLSMGESTPFNIGVDAIHGPAASLKLYAYASQPEDKLALVNFMSTTSEDELALEVMNVSHATDPGGVLQFWGEIQNNGADAVDSLNAVVKLLDASGGIVDVMPMVFIDFDDLPPGEKTPFHTFFPPSALESWSEYEITPTGNPASDSIRQAVPFEAIDVKIENGFSFEISGQVKNVGNWDATDVALHLTVYDAEGKVIGTTRKNLDNLTADESKSFEIWAGGLGGDAADFRLLLLGDKAD